MGGLPQITRDTMMVRMLAACPSFIPEWHAFCEEWESDETPFENGGDGSLPIYLALSDLANHLIARLEAGKTETFPAVFEVVESWITRGEHYVSEAAVVGLVEDLTAKNRYKSAHPNDFLKWLRPESQKWWGEIIDFWDRLDKGNFRPLSID